MNRETESLQELVGRVEVLVQEARWDELAALDESARDIVESATARAREAQAEDETGTVRSLIERLLSLYDQARASAEAERDQAEQELRDTTRTQRAAQAYLDNQ